MKLNHIGLTIREKDEINLFYLNILGFRFEHHFTIDQPLSEQIFDIPQPVEVFLLKKEEMVLELFVFAAPALLSYNHLCIQVNDRERISDRCLTARYPVVRIKRDDKPDLLFIKDRSGNIFELKQKDKV